MLKFADKVIVNTPEVKKLYLDRKLVDPEKIFVLTNGFQDDLYDNNNLSHKDNSLCIGYGGSLAYYDPENDRKNIIFALLKKLIGSYRVDNIDYSTRSPYYLFKSIKYLKENYNIKETDLKIKLWGMIQEGNVDLVKRFGIEKFVQISGYLSKIDSFNMSKNCDILFIPLESEKNGQKPLFIPGKLYEYLKIGKPILALSGYSDCADILKQAGIGIIVNPYDEKIIAEKIIEIIINKDNLYKYKLNNDYVNQFSFKNITYRLSIMFNYLLEYK